MGVEEDKTKFAVEQTKDEVPSAWCNAALDLLHATPSAVDEPVHLARTAAESAVAVGVLPPLGVYDPLGLIETRDMRRYASFRQ